MDSYVNRRIWNTISDHMDEITDLLPSNTGRMSLTTSLTRALKVDLGCDVVEAKDATDKELTSFHGKEFVTELLNLVLSTIAHFSVDWTDMSGLWQDLVSIPRGNFYQIQKTIY